MVVKKLKGNMKVLATKGSTAFSQDDKGDSEKTVVELSWFSQTALAGLTLVRPILLWIREFQPFRVSEGKGELAVEVAGGLIMVHYMARVVTFMVKPRRRDWPYLTGLAFFLIVQILLGEFFEYLDNPYYKKDALCRIFLLHPILAYYIYSVRRNMAMLSDKDLSRYLMDKVFVEGTRFFLLSIFFSLEPIRCSAENQDDLLGQCRTVTLALNGIDYFIFLLFLYQVLLKAHPPAILKKHGLVFKDVLQWSL